MKRSRSLPILQSREKWNDVPDKDVPDVKFAEKIVEILSRLLPEDGTDDKISDDILGKSVLILRRSERLQQKQKMHVIHATKEGIDGIKKKQIKRQKSTVNTSLSELLSRCRIQNAT